MTEPTPYQRYQLQYVVAASAWERAAETARTAGHLSLAYSCALNAMKLRWLAEPEPEVEALFNAEMQS